MDALSRRTALLGAAGVVGAAMTGCTDSNAAPGTGATSSAAVPTTAAPSPSPSVSVDTTPRWPLTGRPLDNPADAERIVVAVKVPDSRNEHPQIGIDKADIVYVQMDGYPAAVGQSGTRLVPVFHSSYADAVNPVRSIRPVDIPMLSPMTAIIGSTGAYPWVLEYVEEFGQYLIGRQDYMASKGTGAYGILSNRVRTLNGQTYYDRAVVCYPDKLVKLAKKFEKGPQQHYFPWAASADEVSTAVAGRAAASVSVPWKSGTTYNMTYTYDSKTKRYLRSEPWGPHVLANGKRVSCDNVLVIRATQVFGKIYRSGRIKTDGGIHKEPIHKIINSTGTFYYANRGKYVKGTWTKGEVNEVFQFTLDDGTPLRMAPGQTFVELPNLKAKVVVKG